MSLKFAVWLDLKSTKTDLPITKKTNTKIIGWLISLTRLNYQPVFSITRVFHKPHLVKKLSKNKSLSYRFTRMISKQIFSFWRNEVAHRINSTLLYTSEHLLFRYFFKIINCRHNANVKIEIENKIEINVVIDLIQYQTLDLGEVMAIAALKFMMRFVQVNKSLPNTQNTPTN